MADMRVDTGVVRQQSAIFSQEGAEQAEVGSLSQSHVEDDVRAFGEINAALHSPWREVKKMQERAWTELGARSDDHAERLAKTAANYDGTEASGTASLSSPGV